MSDKDESVKDQAVRLSKAIAVAHKKLKRPINLMEVCGTHTVALFRHGIRAVLPEGISLLSGPGCPVCVTGIDDVEAAMALSKLPGVVLTTFGDMMRVPGGKENLFDAKADGADIRIVYSPLDALTLAKENPELKIIFFATGFETTSPLVAATVMQALEEGVENFFIHTVHKLVPPALEALIGSGEVKIDGLIMPGHACTITGTYPFDFIAEKYKIPAVVTGFSAVDILEGILMIMNQIVEGKPSVDIQYKKMVRPEGNPKAQEVLQKVFEPTDAYWRGIGSIPKSGYALREPYAKFEALKALGPIDIPEYSEPKGCACGEVLKGLKLPPDCKLFGKACLPEKPVGACMVSAEGSCAAYYKYGGAG
jgi:hydrogenase expression/formation protein HypD